MPPLGGQTIFEKNIVAVSPKIKIVSPSPRYLGDRINGLTILDGAERRPGKPESRFSKAFRDGIPGPAVARADKMDAIPAVCLIGAAGILADDPHVFHTTFGDDSRSAVTVDHRLGKGSIQRMVDWGIQLDLIP